MRPDAVLVLGEIQIAAWQRCSKADEKSRCFTWRQGTDALDERVPEEINRKIVDHISDINMPYSSILGSTLLREGIRPERVIKTGTRCTKCCNTTCQRSRLPTAMTSLGLGGGEVLRNEHESRRECRLRRSRWAS